MERISCSLQLVLKEELDRESLETLKDGLIHVGLGHSVFNVTDENGKQLETLLLNYTTERFYYRLSFIEDLTTKGHSSRSYMTKDAKFFKPKVNGKTLYFLGLNFVIIDITKLERSENFGIDNYKCVITEITVDAQTGDVKEEILWEKSKFGRIENYLPSKLADFRAGVSQCRHRLVSGSN